VAVADDSIAEAT